MRNRAVKVGNRACRREQHARRGAALLEVVVSLSILLLAMSVVGLTFRNSRYNVQLAERISRAGVMTERLVAEMDSGLLDMTEQEQSGWFGEESIPGMSWRVVINPHERIDRLLKIDIHIYMGDPDGTEEERQRVLTTRIWRVEPKGYDLEEDFGLDEDQIQQLTEVIPGGEGVFDPTNFDPRTLAQLDLETLAELLPTLVQAFGLNIAGGQLEGLMQAVQRGDTAALEQAAQQAGAALQAGGQGLPTGQAMPAGGAAGGGGREGGGRGGDRRGGGGDRPPRPQQGTRQGIGERMKGGGKP